MLYKISANMTVSCYCEVEADSEEEALAAAELLPVADIGRYNEEANEAWLIEHDGTPSDMTIDKE